MFRDMIRRNKQLTEEECIGILKHEPRGVLSVQGDDGYPYGMPIDHWYCEADGRIYFHCGQGGHRLDSILRNDKVSFCVYDAGYREEGDWALNIRSVIVFGRMRVVEDHARAIEITRQLSFKYTADAQYIEEEIRLHGAGVLVLALEIEHMCGKLVKES